MRRISKVVFKLIKKLILATIGFMIGLGCSLLLYEFVIKETDFDQHHKFLLFMGSAAFLSVGFAFSRQIRCLAVLTLPEFTSRAGRRTIQATIIILVLSGPLENIADNGQETVRFLACIKNMLLDILIAGKDLVLAPVYHIFNEIKTSDKSEEYNISSLADLLDPIKIEIENDQETIELKDENDDLDEALSLERRSQMVEYHYKSLASDSEYTQIEKPYQRKLAYRCEEAFSKGTIKCIETFKGKYDECHEKVTVVLGWALCWPMKLHFICNILSLFAQDKVCDMGDIIDARFGETYYTAKNGIADFGRSFQVAVKSRGIPGMIDLSDLKSARDELLENYLGGRKHVEWYLIIIKRALTLSYFLVVYGAFEYQRKYFEGLSTDNIYVTKYFRKIDNRRRKLGKETLLPLKSFERQNFTRVNRFFLTESEWKKFGDQLFAIMIQVGVALSIFGFDYLYTELLRLVQNHADMHIRQKGQHVLKIEVLGEGMIAELLRIVIKDFNVTKTVDISHFTKPCLPDPKVTSKTYHERVSLLFLALLANSYFEAHCIRFRHCIGNYFYQRRSRQRTLWLYNETMRRRKAKEAHLKTQALENADKFASHVSRNPLVWIADTFPRICRCLKRWKIARRKCVVCTSNGEVFRCPKCGFSFCEECYKDLVLNRGCWFCIAKEELEERKNELMDSEDDNA